MVAFAKGSSGEAHCTRSDTAVSGHGGRTQPNQEELTGPG